jgi:exopolysaccharide biosynthesis polyprenyl glycosylphosphotransferase
MDSQNHLDPKAARMVELHSRPQPVNNWEQRRIHAILLWWFIKSRFREHTKRFFDLTLAIISLPFVTPVMLITAAAIKLDSAGPVFFKQERVGKNGKPFTCYKFRSMVVDAESRKRELAENNEADEIIFKMKTDPRITRVGRIIRKFSIDEIPQIINILRGDMSLVGPRPPVPVEVIMYRFEHFRRLEAVPGLTGLQQVSGRSDLSFARWVELDVQYIEEQSLLKDIEIILKTIPAVISSKGAY